MCQLTKHKTQVENFSYLSLIQGLNLLIPLVTYPYLIRVLGSDIYGLVVFAQAIIGYLVILVSFGFDISGTKEVSIHRGNPEKLSEIVSGITSIKVALFFVSLLLLSILLFFIPEAKGYEPLFYLSFWLCLYEVIFPIWYFQGIEKMKYITYFTLISRIIFLLLIFVLIQGPSDYLFFPIINAIGALCAGVASIYIIFVKHDLKFVLVPYYKLKDYFIDSVPLFFSNVSIRLYVSTNKVIVGSFLGMSTVAYYDLAEKIINILKMPQGILGQTIFPKISKDKNILFVKKLFKYSLILNTILFLFTLVFSKQIVLFLGGKEMLEAALLVNILALTVPIIAMSNIFGIQLLLSFGYNRVFQKIILSSGLFYAFSIALIWGIHDLTMINVSVVTVSTEIFVTAFMYYNCKKLNLWN